MKALALLCCLAACRAPIETAPVAELPTSVPSVLGPVPIFYVDTIHAADSTRYLIGGYDYYGRRVLIRQEARRNASTARAVAWHEWCHVVLVDAGIRLDGPIMELICDALAIARTSEQRKP